MNNNQTQPTTYEWDQKNGCQGKFVDEGKYRAWFTYYNPFNPTDFSKNTFTIYSNEFTIKESVSQAENYCEKDSDCVFKSGCYCGCYNKDYKNEKLESMFCSCEIEPPGEYPECPCENNKCSD